MKKRLVCTLLAMTLCFADNAIASAAIVSENSCPAEMQIAIEDVNEDIADEAVVEEADMEDLDAEEAGTLIYPDGDDFPTSHAYGHNLTLKFRVSPETKYTVAIVDSKGEIINSAANTSAAGTSSTVAESVELAIGKLAIGDYQLQYWVGGVSDEKVSFQSQDLKIRKSILTDMNKEISKIKVDNAAYTGKSVEPTVTIQETDKEGNVYTLVKDKDFSIKVISENTNKMGAAKVEITGIGDYTGTITQDFDIAPAAVTISEAVCKGYNSAKITWTKSEHAKGYYVYRKEEGKDYVRIAEVAADKLTYTDVASDKNVLEVGKNYYYLISAYATSELDAKKIVSSATPLEGSKVTIAPLAPTEVVLESTATTKVKVKWKAVEGAAGYEVYQKQDNGTFKKIKTLQKNAFLVKNLTCGKNYTFYVRAYSQNKAGQNVFSANSAIVTGKAKPATPKLVSAKTIGSKEIEIKWKQVTKAQGYAIYRKPAEEKDANWKKIGTVKYGDTLSYVDKKATVGVKYVYSVKAYTKVNGKKIWGVVDSKGIQALAAPSQPLILLEQWGKSIAVKIQNVEGADGFYVYKKLEGGNFKKVKTISVNDKSNITVFTDSDMSYKKTYTYYVVPYAQTDEGKVKGAASKKVEIYTK